MSYMHWRCAVTQLQKMCIGHCSILLVFVLLYNAQGITPLGVLLYNEDEDDGSCVRNWGMKRSLAYAQHVFPISPQCLTYSR